MAESKSKAMKSALGNFVNTHVTNNPNIQMEDDAVTMEDATRHEGDVVEPVVPEQISKENVPNNNVLDIQIPPGYRMQLVEKRSKRLQLSMAPTDFNNMKAKADKMNISVNEYINRVIMADLYGQER